MIVKTNKGSNYTRSINEGKYSILRYAIFILLVCSCGSKKKTTEITKEERKEKKNLSVFEESQSNISVDFFSELSTYKFTPIDPKRPIKINGLEIDNAIVDISNKKVDSVVQNNVHKTVQVNDKGEVKETKKEKNQYKEKQIQILWWQWIILIVGFLLIGAWVYFRATGKRIKLPKLF